MPQNTPNAYVARNPAGALVALNTDSAGKLLVSGTGGGGGVRVPTSITTSSTVPFTPDMSKDLYYITTDGSGQAQSIVIPAYSGSVGDFSDPINAGHITLFVIDVLTNSADTVEITVSGGEVMNDVTQPNFASSKIILGGAAGYGVAIVNQYDAWYTWINYTDYDQYNIIGPVIASGASGTNTNPPPGPINGLSSGYGAGQGLTGQGGQVAVFGGSGATQGGSATLTGGSGGTDLGGNAVVQAGNSTDAAGGYVNITSGIGGTSGGQIYVTGGTGQNGSGGSITISGGNGTAGVGTPTSNGGDITLQPGTGVTRNGLIFMPGLPTADPAVAGALWNNAGVLTISAG